MESFGPIVFLNTHAGFYVQYTLQDTYLISACQCGYPFSILNESIALYPALTRPRDLPASMRARYTGTQDSFGMCSSQPISPTKLTRNANT